jgi:hypothetical protein
MLFAMNKGVDKMCITLNSIDNILVTIVGEVILKIVHYYAVQLCRQI